MLTGILLDEYKKFENIIISSLPKSIVKNYYFDLLKKYHPDKNSKDNTKNYSEYSAHIIDLYHSYSQRNKIEKSRYKYYSYLDFFGKCKKYNNCVGFIFHYGVDCYLTANHLFNFQKKIIK